MTAAFRNGGTEIEEEDFCHWTEKDVEFKCLEGLNAKLKKFYSWNKAILIQIEIDGTIFCGCLYQDNNSFAPVKFGPPKRPPLPCIIPSKPKPPKRENDTKTSSVNAYSRENWPRVYIDPHNTVEERLRFGRDKNLSNIRSNTTRRDKENSPPPSKKVGVLVYNNKLKKSSRYDLKSKNLAENISRLRRSEGLHNSFSELQQINVANGSKTESIKKSSAIGFGHSSPKYNKNAVKNFGYKGKKCDAIKKASILPKPNLRPRGAKYISEAEFINSDSESSKTVSSQYVLIDLTVSLTRCDEIQHPTDKLDNSVEIDETTVQRISQQHSIINPENKEADKISIFGSGVFSPTLNVDKILKSSNIMKEEVNDLPKSRSKKKRRKAFEKECSALSDKFEKMTIRTTAFGHPVMQSSPQRELESQGLGEVEHFRISGTEVPGPKSVVVDYKPTNGPSFFRF